jgi:hypothetical protein
LANRSLAIGKDPLLARRGSTEFHDAPDPALALVQAASTTSAARVASARYSGKGFARPHD